MPRPAFTPFADDAAVESLAGLAIENGTRRIALHGSLDIPRDARGLERARALKAAVDAIVAALEAGTLSAEIAEVEASPTSVRNPFA